MIAFFLCLLLQQPVSAPNTDPPPGGTSGQGAPTVTIPRIDQSIEVDGRLDEPAWSTAARLDGFSQYRPVDGRPAEERTEVLIWYSPTALHLGVVAHDRDPAGVRSTVADRDNLGRDDTVTFYLDTFSDRRRAFFFTVNPLGMQEDGVQSEGAFNAGTMFGGTSDKNPDYQWDSRGRLTPEGYVVEVRIPFKSLRYPGNGPQRWGFNVQRKIQRTGYEDTWTDVRRATSFLAQAGGIDGLHDLKRGVVTEIQPFLTTANNGARAAAGGFVRDGTDFNPGANVRLGFTNLSIDATVNPDFSQVESDAGQVTVNERFALFFPEKRPFFLEGIELFSTPNQLVYTRQIVSPILGGKVTGKFGRTTVAYLAAKEKEGAGAALFNVARLRRDLGTNSIVGVTYTDRSGSRDYNRVLAADSRIVFHKVYYVMGQVGRSWTREGGADVASPIWLAEFDRTGRAWGFNYKLTGVGRDFRTRAGFVPRNNIVEGRASNRLTWYGGRGTLVEQLTAFFGPTRIWRFGELVGGAPIEGEENLTLMLTARGGWSVRSSLRSEFVRFDAADYGRHQVSEGGLLAPYDPVDKLGGLFGKSLAVSTPTFRTFNLSLDGQWGEVPVFEEASEGRETRLTATLAMRPTNSIRLDVSNVFSRISRARDNSEFARTLLPRLKIEYQPRRSLFFRMVAEYRSQRQDALADWRTGQTLFVAGQRSTPGKLNGLRLDYLLSFEPTPGTVAFFGYGSTLDSEREMSLSGLRRQSDGFFVKLAYLFRR